MNVIKNITIWIFFSLVLSILPIIDSVIKIYYNSTNASILNVFKDVISHGEIYLITLSTLGVGLGELFKEEPRWKLFKILVGGGSIIIFYFSTSYFTDVSLSRNYKVDFIYDSSVVLLLSSVLLTLSSFIIPKVKMEKKP